MLRESPKYKTNNSNSGLKDILSEVLNKPVFEFISGNLQLDDDSTRVFDSDSIFNIDIIKRKKNVIINLQKINNVRYLNKYFEAVNSKLNDSGYICGCVEEYMQRKKRILKKHSIVISLPAYILDFLLHRVLPKLKISKKIYFFITQGVNRSISKTETYGRLYSCGFEFVCEKEIDNQQYFIFRKKSLPKYDTEPTYGLFVKIKRVARNGKIINVYKLRTMYPFSEYLQDFIYKTNALDEGGKFKNDFRIPIWGRFLRSLWIDELPMLVNWIKRDLKLFGVRPLTKQYYSMYDDDLKQWRIKYKPGLVPPFYVDLPKTIEEIMNSERRYLSLYEKNPLKTDFVYFWKAAYNIIIKRARTR